MSKDLPFPWPEPNAKCFRYGLDPATAAHLTWFGMGSTMGYAEGFLMGVERIIASLRSEGAHGHPDKLFYPVAYLSRHGIELMVKQVIVQSSQLVPPRVTLADLSKRRKRGVSPHNLARLWKILRPMLERLQIGGPARELDATEETMSEFDRLDPDGMAFRYHTDTKGEQHGVQPPVVVDLEPLWAHVCEVTSLLRRSSFAVEDMVERLGR